MRAVIQRVSEATVRSDGAVVGAIGGGLLSLGGEPSLEGLSVLEVLLGGWDVLLVLGKSLSCCFLALHRGVEATCNRHVVLPFEVRERAEGVPHRLLSRCRSRRRCSFRRRRGTGGTRFRRGGGLGSAVYDCIALNNGGIFRHGFIPYGFLA
jgi:hypothetical protein